MKPIHWAVAAVLFLALAAVGARFALESGGAAGKRPPLIPGTAEPPSVESAEVEPAIGNESLVAEGRLVGSELPERDAPESADRAEVRMGAITGSVAAAGFWAQGSIRAYALLATPEGRAARELAPRVFERAPEATAELETCGRPGDLRGRRGLPPHRPGA